MLTRHIGSSASRPARPRPRAKPRTNRCSVSGTAIPGPHASRGSRRCLRGRRNPACWPPRRPDVSGGAARSCPDRVAGEIGCAQRSLPAPAVEHPPRTARRCPPSARVHSGWESVASPRGARCTARLRARGGGQSNGELARVSRISPASPWTGSPRPLAAEFCAFRHGDSVPQPTCTRTCLLRCTHAHTAMLQLSSAR